MYVINESYKINENRSLIVDDLNVLLEDEGIDIFYYGYNSRNEMIMGSYSCEFEFDNCFFQRFINIIIDENDLISFMTKEKSYREILNEKNDIYVLDRDCDHIYSEYLTPLIEIPEDFLPTIDTYFDEEFIDLKNK